MNKKLLINIILYGLLIFGIFGAGALSLDEFQNGPICPTLLGIPACYIILLCFVILSVLYILKARNIYFYIVISLPFSIALYGTIFQIFGGIECPKTSSGIPMCFISLSMFSAIGLLKYLTKKK